jgi:hypothetical protein
MRTNYQRICAGVLAWSVFSVPHLVFHRLHLDMFDAFDQIGIIVTLGGTVILAPLLLPARSSTPHPTGLSSIPAVAR